MTRPPLRLLVVLAALAGGVLVGEGVPTPEVPAAGAGEATVVGARLVCPDVRQGSARTTVATGAAPGATSGDGEDERRSEPLTLRALDGDPPSQARPLPVPAEAPAVADLVLDGGGGGAEGAGAVEVRAVGASAPGLVAQATTVVAAEALRGLAVDRCRAPATDLWLLGGATTVGETAVLVLANPDPEPAVVDVTVLTGEGPADERPGRGISVPASGRLEVPLDRLAPDRSRLAVRVEAGRGRVAAAVRHERTDGVTPRGVAYAAPVPEPAETLQIPGVPIGPGGRSLLLGNPGDVDVEVAVQLTTLDGQFVPDGLDAVAVPAGSTVGVDLSAALGQTPAAVEVTSTGGPVVAVATAEDAGEADRRDLAHVGPASALSAPVLLPDITLGAAEHTLLLSALSGDAVVEVELLPVAGAPPLPAPSRRVDVPGGRTVAVPLAELVPAGAIGRVAVVVTPDPRSAPAHAGLVVSGRAPEGPLLTGFSLASPIGTVLRPPVTRDPAVGAGTD